MNASEPPSDLSAAVEGEFLPGLTLARDFFFEVVQPLLAEQTPGVPYAAALIGPGSDVLGFDTPVSSDHDWGPRLQLFLPERELPERASLLDRVLASELPNEFRGFTTCFAPADANGQRRPQANARPPIDHLIEITSVGRYSRRLLGFDPLEGMSVRRWLLVPQERLLELTGGEVFVDSVGELTSLREHLDYYPKQVWIYLMAAQWRKIAQREALVARAGVGGDDLGSRLILAGLVREIVRLAFLLERRYAPWDQWLARALTRLRGASRLAPALARALSAYDWMQRELRLMDAYAILAVLHNNLGLTKPLEIASERGPRGFLTIHPDRFASALAEKIEDEELTVLLPALTGGVDQLLASDEALLNPALLARLSDFYAGG
ncbi:MAG: DUF4037 domain-containing protein [Gaiellaceae bacterium]